MKSDYFLFPDVECRDFNISNNELESRLEGRKIGAEARFSCPRGFQLAAGPTVVKCQTNGKINIMWNPLMYEKNIALFSLEISSVHMNLNSFCKTRILRQLNVPFSNFPTLVCSFWKWENVKCTWKLHFDFGPLASEIRRVKQRTTVCLMWVYVQSHYGIWIAYFV